MAAKAVGRAGSRGRGRAHRAVAAGSVLVVGLVIVAAVAWLVAPAVVGASRTTVAVALGAAVLLGGLAAYGVERVVRRGTAAVDRQAWLQLREEHGQLLRDVTELEEQLDDLLDNQDALHRQIDEMARATAPLAPVVALPPPPSAQAADRLELLRAAWRRSLPADDLADVTGIGPRLAAELAAIGVVSYRDLARLDADGLQRVRELLDGYPERIEEEAWQSQARLLHVRKYGEAV